MSLSEHETHWKAFLQGLKDRGMNGVKLVVGDTCTCSAGASVIIAAWEQLEERF